MLNIEKGDVVRLTRKTDESTEADQVELVRGVVRAHAVVESADADEGRLTVTSIQAPNQGLESRVGLVRRKETMVLPIADQTRKELLRPLAKGDRVDLRLIYSAGQDIAVTLDQARPRRMSEQEVSGFRKLGLLAIPAIGLMVLTSLISKARATRMFFIGEDNRTSNSKTQGSLWLLVILTVFLAVFILRLTRGDWLFGSIAMPANLAILAGISGLSFVGAKAITVSKEDKLKVDIAAKRREAGELEVKAATAAPDAATTLKERSAKLHAEAAEMEKTAKSVVVAPPAVPPAAPPAGAPAQPVGAPAQEAELTDLINDDRKNPNFGDFQMIMITLVAVIVYIMQAWHFLGTMELTASIALPDIDGSITTLFGISQGSYLGNKAAGKPGQ